MKNVEEKIAEGRQISNYRYSLTYSEICQLMERGNDLFGTISDSFYIGYFQGYKAAKAEIRKVKA